MLGLVSIQHTDDHACVRWCMRLLSECTEQNDCRLSGSKKKQDKCSDDGIQLFWYHMTIFVFLKISIRFVLWCVFEDDMVVLSNTNQNQIHKKYCRFVLCKVLFTKESNIQLGES